jgi:hypothetical protein
MLDLADLHIHDRWPVPLSPSKKPAKANDRNIALSKMASRLDELAKRGWGSSGALFEDFEPMPAQKSMESTEHGDKRTPH